MENSKFLGMWANVIKSSPEFKEELLSVDQKKYFCIREELRGIYGKKDDTVRKQDYEGAARIRDDERRLMAEMENVKKRIGITDNDVVTYIKLEKDLPDCKSGTIFKSMHFSNDDIMLFEIMLSPVSTEKSHTRYHFDPRTVTNNPDWFTEYKMS